MHVVYGQMNEPPGARARVGLTGLCVAEYFRDYEGQDVLLFIDNIFRFTQACSEVSALLGRIPSAVGYQPTLATDLGALQERITSTKKGSITSVQAIYVPADDLTDPAPATPLLTWTPPPSCPDPFPNWASILPWIPWTRRAACSILVSLAPSTTMSPVVFNVFFNNTRVSKILLPFLGWMNWALVSFSPSLSLSLSLTHIYIYIYIIYIYNL